jgi:hypothetical protein
VTQAVQRFHTPTQDHVPLTSLAGVSGGISRLLTDNCLARSALPQRAYTSLCKQGFGRTQAVPALIESAAWSGHGWATSHELPRHQRSLTSTWLRRRRSEEQPRNGAVGVEGDGDHARLMGHRDVYSFDVDLALSGKHRRTVASIRA